MAKKDDYLELYKARLDIGKRWRKEEGYEEKWRRMIDMYRGKHFAKTAHNGEDRVAVNLAFSTVNIISPAVSVNHPRITVSPNRTEDVDRAIFVESVANYLWRHHDFRKPFRRAVKDSIIVGHGWIKVGWRYKEGQKQLSDQDRQIAYQTAVEEASAFARQNPDQASDVPTNEEIMANLPHTEAEIIADQPFVERISPFDIFVDPEATCLDDAKWIAQRIVRPLEDVKKDKRFKSKVRKSLEASASVKIRWENDTEREQYAEITDRVTLWEYYDLEEGVMAVCAEGSDDFLADPMEIPYSFGHPFVFLANYDVPDTLYPMGDLEAIESLQEELNKTRSQMVNHRKRYARKYMYHERSFNSEGREALESEEDGRFVPVVDENRPLGEVVVPLPQVPLAPEIYNHSGIIEEDINVVSGVSEYARGQMPEIRRTATEASLIADAANSRVADKLALVEIAIGEVARRVIQLMQQYMTDGQIVRIVGKDGSELFVPYVRDDIAGEYDFIIEAGSTQPNNDTIRRSQAINLMQAVAPLVGQVIDPAELARHVLTNGFGIKDPEKFLISQNPMGPEGGPPQGDPAAQVPPAGAAPMPQGGPPMPPMPQGMAPNAPAGGIPPEMIAQLQGQMGLGLDNL